MTTKEKTKLRLLIFLTFFIFANTAGAFSIERRPEAKDEGRFVVGPAKSELSIDSGETKSIAISVENRTGHAQAFKISFEDFVSGNNENETVKLLGLENSKTTLKDFLYADKDNFLLEQGERATVYVSVSIPGFISPGGRFGAVVVSAIPLISQNNLNDRAYAGSTVISRVATLLFVTVRGDVERAGKLISFSTKSDNEFFIGGKTLFRLEFENTGNVNLNPYGGITIRNMFGKDVQKIPLDPWYALPESIRTRDKEISLDGMFGKYSAVAEVNRGYEDIVDVKEITFYVLPISTIILFVLIVIGVAIVVRAGIRSRKKQ